jgi:hypothetical protein
MPSHFSLLYYIYNNINPCIKCSFKYSLHFPVLAAASSIPRTRGSPLCRTRPRYLFMANQLMALEWIVAYYLARSFHYMYLTSLSIHCNCTNCEVQPCSVSLVGTFAQYRINTKPRGGDILAARI